MNKKKLSLTATKYFYFLIDEDIQEDDECYCKLMVQNWDHSRLAIPIDAIDYMGCEFRESCNHILKITDEEIARRKNE